MASSREKSQVLGAHWKLSEIYRALYDEVTSQGGSEKDLFRIPTDRELCRDLARRILSKVSEDAMIREQSHKVFVDYELDRKVAVQSGCYDWVNPRFEECDFEPKRKGREPLVAELVAFEGYVSTDRVLKTLQEKSLVPLTVEGLLAFGAAHPDVQRSRHLVALGSVTKLHGEEYVAGLWGSGSKRNLLLTRMSEDWTPNHRFLVTRNAKAGTG